MRKYAKMKGGSMKRKASWIFVVALILGLTASCAIPTQAPKDPFLTGAYRTLTAMDATYDASWSSFVMLYKDGLIKQATFDEGFALAVDYYSKWRSASDYLLEYAAGGVPQEGFDLVKEIAQKALEEMKNYLKEKSGGIKPII